MKKYGSTILILALAGYALYADNIKKFQTMKKNATVADKNNTATDQWIFLPDVIAKMDYIKVSKEQFVKYFSEAEDSEVPAFIDEKTLKRVTPKLIEKYLLQAIFLEEAKKAGIEPSYELAKKELCDSLALIPPQRVEMIRKNLAMNKMTITQFIDRKAKSKKLQNKFAIDTFIKRSIALKTKVTNQEIKDYYKNNKVRFTITGDPKGSIRISYILIAFDKNNKVTSEVDAKARKEAEDILIKINNGKSFDLLVNSSSDCHAAHGGRGTFNVTSSRGEVFEALKNAVKKLKVGEVSKPVKTQLGYHIIRREPLRKRGMIPFDSVKNKIKRIIKTQKIYRATQALNDEMLKKHNVEIIFKHEKL